MGQIFFYFCPSNMSDDEFVVIDKADFDDNRSDRSGRSETLQLDEGKKKV